MNFVRSLIELWGEGWDEGWAHTGTNYHSRTQDLVR